ncbi:hypothetical protein HDV64DRAFT_263774 [Trichoderma sp. TUCIM 5745]
MLPSFPTSRASCVYLFQPLKCLFFLSPVSVWYFCLHHKPWALDQRSYPPEMTHDSEPSCSASPGCHHVIHFVPESFSIDFSTPRALSRVELEPMPATMRSRLVFWGTSIWSSGESPEEEVLSCQVDIMVLYPSSNHGYQNFLPSVDLLLH